MSSSVQKELTPFYKLTLKLTREQQQHQQKDRIGAQQLQASCAMLNFQF